VNNYHERDTMQPMNILDIAINAEKGVSNLARAIGEKPNTVGNWRKRGTPRAWVLVLSERYKKHIKQAKTTAA